jgi:hypothetical protein
MHGTLQFAYNALATAALEAQMPVRFGCSSDHDTHIGGASLFRCGRAACSLASSVILDPDIKRTVNTAPAFLANSMRIRPKRNPNFALSLFLAIFCAIC